MFTWSKNKIFGRLRYWLSEQSVRMYQELHTQRLKEMSKNLPDELVEINKILTILNNNSWAVHHLFIQARNKKQYANAFLYFFYSFELTLKHLIISEMNLQNMSALLLSHKNEVEFFNVYKKENMFEILEGEFTSGGLIKKFLNIFPYFLHRNDLWTINNERKFIIHNMMKKEVSEIDIGKSFKNFFQKTGVAIDNSLKEFDDILEKRPKDILKRVTELSKNEN